MHAKVVVDEIDIPRRRHRHWLRNACERVHVADRDRHVERDQERPYVRLSGLAARNGAKALLVEIDTRRAVYRHSAVYIGPRDANVVELNPPWIRPDRRDDPLWRDAKHVGPDERERKRRHVGNLHIQALVALDVAGQIVAVVQTGDLEPHDTDAPEEEVNGCAVCTHHGLNGVGTFAVVEPDAANPCAAAKAERRGIALEHDVRRHVRTYGGDDPVGGNSLLAEKQAPDKDAKNDEDPLHRLDQDSRRFLHCRRRPCSSLVWQPLGESNSSYLDENQMS